MKNTILARFAHAPLVRIFGIIALTAVIVFSMAGCPAEEEEQSPCSLKVVNQNALNVVVVYLSGGTFQCNIPTGGSQTFALDSGWDGGSDRMVQISLGTVGNYLEAYFPFARGETTTITVTADNKLE